MEIVLDKRDSGILLHWIKRTWVVDLLLLVNLVSQSVLHFLPVILYEAFASDIFDTVSLWSGLQLPSKVLVSS